MNFVATVYTRLFQLLAVPTIVLAVMTTFATFGSKGSGRIFGRTLIYTLLTTFAAAAVGAILYVLIAPGNLPVGTALDCCGVAAAQGPDVTYSDHSLKVMSCRCCCWLLPSVSVSRNSLSRKTRVLL